MRDKLIALYASEFVENNQRGQITERLERFQVLVNEHYKGMGVYTDDKRIKIYIQYHTVSKAILTIDVNGRIHYYLLKRFDNTPMYTPDWSKSYTLYTYREIFL